MTTRPASASDAAVVDMSPAAIDRRMRELGQLHALGTAMRRARLLGPASETAQDVLAQIGAIFDREAAGGRAVTAIFVLPDALALVRGALTHDELPESAVGRFRSVPVFVADAPVDTAGVTWSGRVGYR